MRTVEEVVRRGPSYVACVVAIAIAWFLPYLALFLYFGIALYLTVRGGRSTACPGAADHLTGTLPRDLAPPAPAGVASRRA